MVMVDPVPVAELNPTIDALLVLFWVPSSLAILDPSKYQLISIDPSFTPSVGLGNDAVAIPVKVATPITSVWLWGSVTIPSFGPLRNKM